MTDLRLFVRMGLRRRFNNPGMEFLTHLSHNRAFRSAPSMTARDIEQSAHIMTPHSWRRRMIRLECGGRKILSHSAVMTTTVKRESHFAAGTIDSFMVFSPRFDETPFKQVVCGFDKRGSDIAETHMQRFQYLVIDIRTCVRIVGIVAVQRSSHLTKMSRVCG